MAVDGTVMIGWWAGLAIAALLAGSFHHIIISKICRPRDELRCGTLQDLTPAIKDAKFEIIAVPGLGAHPYHTWEARRTPIPSAADHQTARSVKVHLLKNLLACDFPDARIWNFTHDSNWLIDAPVKTSAEIGKCLLAEIKDKRSSSRLPIIFIGHSLGGIIIKQALCSSGSRDIVDDTSGILFLGVPHQGSSVSVFGAALAVVTRILGSDTTLLLSLRTHHAQLSNLGEAFESHIAPNERREQKVPVVSFYETKKTYLLGLSLGVVVSRDSAVIHADTDQIHSVETDHSGLNKCGGPTDALYTKIAEAIRHLKSPSLLEQADTWIRDKHYTADRLKIERLSRDQLAMDQCYINLAVVEQSGQDGGRLRRERGSSPFSILERQKVMLPDETFRVELSELFDERKSPGCLPMHPRRIFIRGRAGVGKTTLCKKIIYEFIKGSWIKWNELFDRVLWVPLRNLKLPERRRKAKYSFEHLFSHEFLLPTNGQNLARALSCAVDTKNSRTLFLLDGLDEVSQDLTGSGSMARFLIELLNKPNVIITARPSAKPPANLDLELETIGFGPDQVNEYIEKSFTDPKSGESDQAKVAKVQSFLEERWIIQGLVRIPIQLDALCYTWDDLRPDGILNTMTHMYKEIELKLWKKDILRLEKKHREQDLTEDQLDRASRRTIKGFIKDELTFIESLAFTGLHNDIIAFTSEHLNSISDHFSPDLLPDKSLPSISFLRTSDLSSEYRHRNYHFIHLTFQEYFAARYYARRWNEQEGQLQFLTFSSRGSQSTAISPAQFLRKHKYTARYDIFWRFVAGLLDADGHAPAFIKAVEEEPLDLLGPTHQRLVMHCLGEISIHLPVRESLESRLLDWLLFECKFKGSASLAADVEFPERSLQAALQEEPPDVQQNILRHWGKRRSISPILMEAVAFHLKSDVQDVRSSAIHTLGLQATLPTEILAAVVARLGDEDSIVRASAAFALGQRSTLPDEILAAMAARLDDKDSLVRSEAATALGQRATLPTKILAAVVARLGDEDSIVRASAAFALGQRSTLPDEILAAMAAQLDDKDSLVRSEATTALGQRATLPDEILAAVVARLGDEDSGVRWPAASVLGQQAILPHEILAAMAARLDDNNAGVRASAAFALGRRATLPDEILAAVAARLDDEDAGVRASAASALGRRATLPDEILAAVAARLDDKNAIVRRSAALALRQPVKLPVEILAALAVRLGDEDERLRRHVTEVLGQQSTLPDEILAAMVAQLGDEDEHVRNSAALALGQRSTLPDKILAAVVTWLGDEDKRVRGHATEVLGQQSTLPDEILAAIAAQLDDEDAGVRGSAAFALGWQATLPLEILAAVATQLSDEDPGVRWQAASALGQQATLPDEILAAVAAQLGNEDLTVRGAAETILRMHEKFYCTLLHGPHIKSLYKASLENSFGEQLSWYIVDGKACVNGPNGIMAVSMSGSSGIESYESRGTQNAEHHLWKSHGYWDPSGRRRTPLQTKEGRKAFASITDLMGLKRLEPNDQALANNLIRRFDQAEFQKLVVNWIVESQQSFRQVEQPRLRQIFEYLNPAVRIKDAHVTAKTIQSLAIQQFERHRDAVQHALRRSPGQIHIAFDGARTKNRHALYGVTAVFRDEDNQLRKLVLGIPELVERHSGENIAAEILDIIRSFGIQDKVGYFTLDNAANNDTAMREIAQELHFDPVQRRVRCVGHILNLVVKSLLFGKDVEAFEDTVAKGEALARAAHDTWMRRGPVGKAHNFAIWDSYAAADDAEVGKQRPVDVVIDNDTRWLSQYYMIKRLLRLQPFYEEFIAKAKRIFRDGRRGEVGRRFPPCLEESSFLTENDWAVLRTFDEILSDFHVVVQALQGDGQPRCRASGIRETFGSMADVLEAFEFLLSKLEDAKSQIETHPEPEHFGVNVNLGWMKLDKYYNTLRDTPVYYAAAALHPGLRWTYFDEIWGRHHPEWVEEAKQIVQQLWSNEYSNLQITVASTADGPALKKQKTVLSSFDKYRNRHRQSNAPTAGADEYARWQASMSELDRDVADPVEYWHLKRFEYPKLSRMALDVMTVPAMSAECERLFSAAGLMVTPLRNRMDAGTIGLIQTLRSWLRAGIIKDVDNILLDRAVSMGLGEDCSTEEFRG